MSPPTQGKSCATETRLIGVNQWCRSPSRLLAGNSLRPPSFPRLRRRGITGCQSAMGSTVARTVWPTFAIAHPHWRRGDCLSATWNFESCPGAELPNVEIHLVTARISLALERSCFAWPWPTATCCEVGMKAHSGSKQIFRLRIFCT